MSVLWMDDPSFYSTSGLGGRYNTLTGGPTISAGSGRFGNSSFHFPPSGGAVNIIKNIPGGALATITVALSYNLNTGGVGPLQIINFLDTGTSQVDVRINAANQLYMTRGGTQIGPTSTNALSVGVWNRIEVKVTIDPSAGVIELQVNGSSTGWIPSTGSLNTRSTSNSSTNQVQIGGTPAVIATPPADFNDLVFTDTNSPNANFLGDQRCYVRFPSSNSSVTWTPIFASWTASTVMAVGQQIEDSNGNVQRVQSIVSDFKTGSSPPTWATTGGSTTIDNHVTWIIIGIGSNPGAQSWMAVSENPADDDNSYNSSSTAGQVDLFVLPPLPSTLTNVIAIDNIARVRKDDAGTRTFAGEVNSGGTVVVGSNIGLSSSYIYNDQIFDQDPHTSAAWTISAANALLVGYKEIV